MVTRVGGDQRRRVRRIPADFPVILWQGRNRLRCQTRQLSEFGMLVATNQRQLVGERIQVDFALDSPIPALSLSATVSYAIDAGIGIRFDSLDLGQRLALQDYIRDSELTLS